MEFTSTLYKLRLNNISISPLSYNTYYKKPIRVTHLTGDDAVVSFYATNTTGSFFPCNGLFSFRVNPPSVIAGAYDQIPCTLVDVARYKDTVASVTLIETGTHNYQAHTIRWSSNTLSLFSISDTSRILQSIDTRKQSNNTQSLLVGGLIGTGPDRCWKLLDQDYFNNVFTSYCFPNSIGSPFNASIGTGTMNSNYLIYDRFPNDPTAYPMTIITKTNIEKPLSNICSEPED